MNKEQFNEKLRANPRPVIIDLWAPWCMPCRAMNPILEKASQEYKGKVDLWKINADEEADLLRSFGVMGIPTLIGFNGDREIFRRTGAQSVAMVNELFQAVISGAPVRRKLTSFDRWLRAGSGLALVIFGWTYNQSILLMALGGVLMFSAVYDRCPIYKAVSEKVAGLFRRSAS